MARRRLLSSRRKRRVALRLTLAVVALHAGLLLMLAVMPTDPPRQGTWLQLLWATEYRPSFYVLSVVLIGAPVLTVAALPIRGRHRAWLAVSWGAVVILAGAYYAHRLGVMTRILWNQV